MNKSVKRTAYLKYTFCNIVLVFTVTFDQCWINVLNSFRKKVLHERLWFVPDTKLFNDFRRLYWLFSSAFGPLKSLKASVTVFYQSMKNSSVKILSLLLNPVEERKSYRICKCNIFFFSFTLLLGMCLWHSMNPYQGSRLLFLFHTKTSTRSLFSALSMLHAISRQICSVSVPCPISTQENSATFFD